MKDTKIDKRNVIGLMGLTSMQEGMLFHYLADPGSKQYFEQFRFTLSGKIDREQFNQAWRILAQTNEILRAVFQWKKLEEPLQIILKEKEIPVRIVDLTQQDEKQPPRLLKEILREDRNNIIDLNQHPLRITLCIIDENRSEMILTFHHILYDGWSQGIILGEFLNVYNRLVKCKKIDIIHKTRFIEFLKWCRSLDQCRQQDYWGRYLGGFDTLTSLPYDKNKLVEISQVDTCSLEAPPAVKEQMENCSQEYNITSSTIFYAAWGLLLQKYNNAGDVIFGTTVSGRAPEIKGIEKMVGLFINTLPLRLQASRDHTVQEIFQSIGNHLKERSQDGLEHSSLIHIKQSTGIGLESNLFDSIVVIDNYPLDNLLRRPSDQELQVTSYELFEMTNFDLTVQILLLEAGRIRIDFHYNADLFEEETIRRMIHHYMNILTGMLRHSTAAISWVQMLSEKERNQILEEFNNPCIAYPVEETIHSEIETQVSKTPQRRAVTFEDRCITYRELNNKANRLAYLLEEHGVTRGSRVAVLFPRSIEMIIAILGILKVGAVCIPLDISYPEERNRFIIKDSEAGLILTTGGAGIARDESSSIYGVTSILLDPLRLDVFPIANPGKIVAAKDLSYIIYTSGSTGKPKGALLHHSGIVNHTYTKIGVLGITGNDIVANNFSINVIASVWQILAPFFKGASLVIYSQETEWDPYRQFQQAEADGITVIEIIPSVLKAYLFILDEGKDKVKLEGLHKIALTTEETKPFLVNKFYARYTHIDLVNCYGQTECCDDVLHFILPRNTDTKKVPIGTPSLNTNIFILNHHDQLQPIGAAGEICVQGAGVAYGYWKRPELNQEKFIMPSATRNPFVKGFPGPSQNFCIDKNFSGGPGGRFFKKAPLVYRTGDLGRWLADGKVEYLGRLDHQVKIRGNRIELREIENQMMGYSVIKEAAVVAREDREGDKSLYAFFLSDEDVTVSDLRCYLLKSLPDYMVPSFFVRMEKLPLTPNGKIDRKVLAKIEVKESIAVGVEYRAPQTDIEIKIQEIWGQVLDRKAGQIGINDNFFDVGGHSLLLLKLKSRLEKNFDLKKEIGIIELFNYPTIVHQAKYIADRIEFESQTNEDGKENSSPGTAAAGDNMPPGESNFGGDREAILSKKGPLDGGSKDIAVIGMSLQAPGADNIHEFWMNLVEGVESISFFREDELDGSEAYRLVQDQARRVAAGGILGDVDSFDADFFGINPGEAEIMDPQHRLFLEHAWKALEDAGYVGETYPGSIGVYAGVGWNIHLLNNALSNPGIIRQRGEFQTMIGNEKDFFTSRVAYKLNLRGPALTVQTACSTSLVAVHLAKQGLLNGECDMALAGGVAVKVPERTGYFYAEGGHLSPDGHCRPFDAEARGTVFGNGAGIVVLKRSAEALKDNDHIYAVIKGSAVNNDGSLKIGYTSPSEIGQSEVILRALGEAGAPANTIGYIETHGTGTSLGDPVEITALTRAFRTWSMKIGEERDKKQYCALGSIKANMGHLDVAAGIIGFIKAVLCLKYRQIPPSINVRDLNPLIDFANSPFYVNRTLKDWSENRERFPRRVGVSSLGIGGTNAHVILEEAARPIPDSSSSIAMKNGDYRLIVLSARSESALEKMTQNLADHIRRFPGIDLTDAAYTLQVGRKFFKHRCMLVCSDAGQLVDGLSTAGRENLRTSMVEEDKKSIVFMFPGLGSQYVNMGRQLYHSEPVFRQEMDRCFEILKPLLGYDVKNILYPLEDTATRRIEQREENQPDIQGIEIAQVVVLILEYALSRLLMSWGIIPAVSIGYSFGEYTAALISGVFTLEEALKLVVSRGRLIRSIASGAMLSIPLGSNELVSLLDNHKELSIAIDNGSSCVVSGPTSAVEVLETRMKRKGYLCMRVPASYAIHSPMMEPIMGEFKRLFDQVTLNKPKIPYISNVTGKLIQVEDVTNPHYWYNHLRNTVCFAAGLVELMKDRNTLFLEVGPGHELSGLLARQMGKERRQPVLNLVRHPDREASDVEFLLKKIGLLWLNGIQIDWAALHRLEKCSRLPLPTYPFERQHFRIETAGTAIKLENIPRTKKTDIADWFYLPQWERSQLPSCASIELPPRSCLLIFVDNSALGLRLQERLYREYKDLIMVKAGSGFRKIGEQIYEINPQQSGVYNRIMEELKLIQRIPATIVYLWTITDSADVEAFQARPRETVRHSMKTGVQSLLYLTQAIVKQDFSESIKIFTVSSQLYDITGEEPLTPQQSPILGLLKVIPQEYTDIYCRYIDIQLPAPGSINETKLVELLALEFKTESIDPVVAYRMNRRWVQIFKPFPLQDENNVIPALRSKGVYLITGGLGNIGFTLSSYLARTINARLILTGLTPLPPRSEWENYRTPAANDELTESIGSKSTSPSAAKIRKILELENQGAEVFYIACDAADPVEMLQKITQAEERFGPINGVIHAVVAPSRELIKSIDETDEDEFITQFHPKIYGLLALGDIFHGRTLDFGIIISSPSSILGGLGFGAYAAANSFLDAYVYWFNRTGSTPWLTVNWGDWLFEDARDNSLPGNPLHYLLITPEEGVTTFKRILRWRPHNVNQIVISAADLQERIDQWVRLEFKQQIRPPDRKDSRSHLALPYTAPGNRMEKLLSEIWENYLGIEQVGIHDNFFELGATSLDIIQLNRKVKEATGRDIAVSTFFRYPNINQLALHLSRQTGEMEPSERAVQRSAKMQNARKNLQQRVRTSRR